MNRDGANGTEVRSAKPPIQDHGNLVESILWVWNHLETTTTQDDVPTSGTWPLLKWARQYQVKCCQNMLPKALAAKEKWGQAEAEEAARAEEHAWDAEKLMALMAESADPIVCPECGYEIPFLEAIREPRG